MITFKASVKSRGFFVCLGVVLGLGKFAALNGDLPTGRQVWVVKDYLDFKYPISKESIIG